MRPIIFLTSICLLSFSLYSCSLASKKSERNQEKEQSESGVNSKHETTPQISEQPTEEEQFDAAMNAMKKKAFTDAVFLWKDYVTNFAGFPNFNEALIQYSRALHKTGLTELAIEALKPLVETPESMEQAIDVKMLYAEFLVAKKRSDEALALTFDMLPDKAMQAKLGIAYRPTKFRPDEAQKIKILTLRGWLFAELAKENEAYKSLARARLNLARYKTTKQAKRALTALVALRQIQMLSAACKAQSALPEKLSEEEFVEFSEKYYKCVDPARIYICEIREIEDPVFYSDGVGTYKHMVLYPSKLTAPLPPPSRKVKDSQKSAYEAEMKFLIETTVEAHVKRFKDIEGCDAFDIF